MASVLQATRSNLIAKDPTNQGLLYLQVEQLSLMILVSINKRITLGLLGKSISGDLDTSSTVVHVTANHDIDSGFIKWFSIDYGCYGLR